MTHTQMLIESCKIKDELAKKHWELKGKLGEITVSINARLRTTAGRAKHREQSIELSYYIFREEANRSEFRNTVVHELAHLLAGCGNGHNAIWKAMHRKLGGSAKRCHTMEAGVRHTARDYKAICNTCGEIVMITKRKYNNMNKVLARGGKYRHKACGGSFGVQSPYQTCENAHLGFA